VRDVETAYKESMYASRENELKGFQILEGVYTFLAYVAFVKDKSLFQRMLIELKKFRKERGISTIDILLYRRFERNYFLSLPLRKKLFYGLYLLNVHRLLFLLIRK